MTDDKKPSRFEELMRGMGRVKQFPIDLQPIDPAAPLAPEASEARAITTTFVLWDGDPAVIIKTGARAKAVRLDAIGGWVTVDASALWFDERRNVIAQPEDDLPPAFGSTAEALRVLDAAPWQEIKRPADRPRWGED